jgi:hypothetical protein
LEFVAQELPQLLPSAQLSDTQIRELFERESFWMPELEAGDALLFRGDMLHRTHVTPSMTQDRTSIELRFFAGESLPKRLQRV